MFRTAFDKRVLPVASSSALLLALAFAGHSLAQNVENNEKRGDQPEAYSDYWIQLHASDDEELAMEAMPNAIEKVRELRNRVAQEANAPPFAIALMANRSGFARRVAGIPVGPLPATLPLDMPLPAAAELIDLPEAEQTRLRRSMVPRVLPLAASVNPTDWMWLGPGNIGGRTRALLIHPTNPQVMWLGGIAGGIWRTEDAGVVWAPVNDFMASLVVSCMALDPTDPDVLYAGTGEGFFNGDAFRGFGIFRSQDEGLTWNQLPSTAGGDFQWVNRIAISSDGNVLLVATRKGLFRSTDDGGTFTRITTTISTMPGSTLGADNEVLDVRFHPTDNQRCVLSGRGGQIHFSTDGGQTWAAAQGVPVDHNAFEGRVELAYAVANPTVIYASVDSFGGRVYRSTDGGQNFVLRGTPGHLRGQGWYANTIWAGDTIDPNLVVVGGLDLHRSADGGQSFTKISRWQSSPQSAHADHHTIVSHPGYNGSTNRTVLFGNDGGIYRAADVTTVSELSGWQELNNGLGITQFYGAAVNHQTGEVVGGTQDNGTLFLDQASGPETFDEIAGGDGGFAAAHPTDPLFYGEFQWMQLHRSSAGADSVSIDSNLPEAGLTNGEVLFIAPFVLDPNDPEAMLAGGARLWRSNNVEAANPTWASIKTALGAAAISAIAIESGNSASVWVGHARDGGQSANWGAVFKTTNGTAASPNWTRVGQGTLPSRHCTRITIDPHDATRVLATFGGYEDDNLWVTTNGGNSWSALGVGELPEVPAYDIDVHPDDADALILANEVGVFVSDDGGQTWFPTNQGPTNCAVFELFWRDLNLYAATHGRGIFRINTASPAPPAAAAAPFTMPEAKAVLE